jgi:hypothetical protein
METYSSPTIYLRIILLMPPLEGGKWLGLGLDILDCLLEQLGSA